MLIGTDMEERLTLCRGVLKVKERLQRACQAAAGVGL